MAKQRQQDTFDLTLGGHPPLKGRNQGQDTYLKACAKDDMVIGLGPAGTGKTFLAAGYAAEQLATGKVEQVVLCRPAVTIEDENHGFLPGGMRKKMEFYLLPLIEAMKDRIGHKLVEDLIVSEKIRIMPIGHVRGLTFKKSIVLVDEAQNLTEGQAKALVTRIGEGTKYLINGDLMQTDIVGGNGLRMLETMVYRHELPVTIVRFTAAEVVRSKMCRLWVEAFEKETA